MSKQMHACRHKCFKFLQARNQRNESKRGRRSAQAITERKIKRSAKRRSRRNQISYPRPLAGEGTPASCILSPRDDTHTPTTISIKSTIDYAKQNLVLDQLPTETIPYKKQLHIVTLNLKRASLREAAFYAERNDADIICLQETGITENAAYEIENYIFHTSSDYEKRKNQEYEARQCKMYVCIN